MARLQFLPQSHDFFADFSVAGANAAAAGEVLATLFQGDQDVAGSARQLRDLEHRGDEITHAILYALGRSFVTPINREDIRELARRLDNYVDEMEEAGSRASLVGVGQSLPAARRLADIVRAQAQTLAEALPLLSDARRDEALSAFLEEIHRLENEADDLLNDTLAALYDGVADVPGVIRARQEGEICGTLEAATDQAERAAHVMQGIIGQRR